jgi:hypothetical protein
LVSAFNGVDDRIRAVGDIAKLESTLARGAGVAASVYR